jgi:mRNA interferase MazF
VHTASIGGAIEVAKRARCPVTSQIKGYPFDVLLPEGLPVLGAVLSDQVRLLDWRARKASRICRLPDEITADVLGKLQSLLARDQ